MTEQEIIDKSILYTRRLPDTEDGICSWNDVQDGYIAGWKACESSPEYKELRDGDDNFSLIQEAVQKWRDEYIADTDMKTDEAMAKLGWLIASTMEIL